MTSLYQAGGQALMIDDDVYLLTCDTLQVVEKVSL
jgi:hypothetical protein